MKNPKFGKGFVIVLMILLIGVSVSASQYKKNEPIINYDCLDLFNGPLTKEEINALQKQAEIEEWTFSVGETSASKRSIDQLCGLEAPDKWWVNAVFTPMEPLETLPSKFDWRDEVTGGLPSIKDQGDCGSCWAFATVGALECNIKIRDKIDVDLSEQWLVSCNQETSPGKWGCSGGWWAHDYFLQNGKKDPCGDSGAVLESNFPYTEMDDPCNCPYQHDYFIERCAYVGTDHTVPSVELIKQAIYDYGPISVAICAGAHFIVYTGGVFNHERQCPPFNPVNHAVVLVGWDDSQGENGVWILRNSWGDEWGENGYMLIEYGCSKIGYGARYVEYSDRFTVLCVDESTGPGSSNIYTGIQNALVTVKSIDGNVHETGYTNKDGRCYFYDLPEGQQYIVKATHDNWNQTGIEWKSEHYVIIFMSTEKGRLKIADFQFLDYFPILKIILQNIIRLRSITN